MVTEYKLYDASDKILGRFCSQIAKKAMLGEYIVIINAKDAIISGSKGEIHKVIKQMLPRKKLRGKQIFKLCESLFSLGCHQLPKKMFRSCKRKNCF